MIKYLYLSTIVLILTLFSLSALGQVIPPGPGKRPPGPPGKIPIDGGISILAAAGAAYGVRKLYLTNKLDQESERENG